MREPGLGSVGIIETGYQSFAGDALMFDQKDRGFGEVTDPDSVADGAVFGERGVDAGRDSLDAAAGGGDLGPEVVERFQSPLCAGCISQQEVELAIEARIATNIAGADGGLGFSEVAADRGELR